MVELALCGIAAAVIALVYHVVNRSLEDEGKNCHNRPQTWDKRLEK